MVCRISSLKSICHMTSVSKGMSKAAFPASTGGGLQSGRLQVIHADAASFRADDWCCSMNR
jgi:hypothetical protein